MTNLPISYERIPKMPRAFYNKKYPQLNYRDTLIITNHADESLDVLIRINGQKFDMITLPKLSKKYYYLKEVALEATITIEKLVDKDSIHLLHLYEKLKKSNY